MTDEELLRNGLLVSEMREETLAALQADHAWGEIDKMLAKLPDDRHLVEHLAECIDFPAQAGFYQFACKFGQPLDDMARAA